MSTTIAPPPPGASQERKVIDAKFPCCWLSWAGATQGCLNALGVECDLADVAGHSGYAFRIQVHARLCPSGPTNFSWDTLLSGVRRLGRSTLVFTADECHSGDWKNDRTTAHCAAAFDVARREIDAGRPCVILGAYIPEFAVCVGVECDHYLVDSCRRHLRKPQPPIRFDELDAPGGLYVLAFPTATKMPREKTDRDAINHAVEVMSANPVETDWGFGADGYDVWARSLLNRKDVIPFGNAYNAQCWAEARRLAEKFVDGVASRNEHVPLLRHAHDALNRAAEAMNRVAKLFPFPAKADGLSEQNRRAAAADALRTAQAADIDAATLLREALRTWKPPAQTPGD